MCALGSAVVQWFFAWRIYVVSTVRARVLVAGIVTLSLVQATCGIVVGAEVKSTTSVKDIFSTSRRICLIAMVRRKTGIPATDLLVDKISRLVVETGTITASVAIVGFVLAVVYPKKGYFQPA
ncbi:uncharacterized protein B0H18DRAFT_1120245 [Fomitopsis serialis]|uniref:uncharacterized protein n=1 Tax=Fomitopsis serialis TaxID=139415 RepID=UPI0020081044|nr:uncharacterized protein B0H18DRAFT_1120245 [Neoantrodia serialis]KAH9923904.1 hypothetical protein B0H18DRAFT_1120245 [Neoantrodia serialis]